MRYRVYGFLEYIFIFSIFGRFLTKIRLSGLQRRIYRYLLKKQKRIEFEQIYTLYFLL